MKQHTKGPWAVKPRVEVFGTIPIRCNDSGKPPLAYVVDLCDVEEQQANAVLIAAAPAMLEALKDATVLVEASYLDLAQERGENNYSTRHVFEELQRFKAMIRLAEGRA